MGVALCCPNPRLGAPPSATMAGWIQALPLQGSGAGAVQGAARWVLFATLAVGMFAHRALGLRGNAASPWQAWQLSLSYPLVHLLAVGKLI